MDDGRRLTRSQISAAVDHLGWRLILGTVRTAVAVGGIAHAADVARAAAEAAGAGGGGGRRGGGGWGGGGGGGRGGCFPPFWASGWGSPCRRGPWTPSPSATSPSCVA